MPTLSETLSLRFEFMQPTCTQFFQFKWPKKKLALAVIFYMQPIPLKDPFIPSKESPGCFPEFLPCSCFVNFVIIQYCAD